MENNYTVYIHTNPVNQKRYIGMTKMLPEMRWKKGAGYIKNKEFYREICQYGWNNFNHDIVYYNLTKLEAQQKEVELINMYDTMNEEHGYNKIGTNYNTNQYYKPKEKDKVIYCIELDKVFKTSIAAWEETGVDYSSILKVCKGERQSAGKHPQTGAKLHWKFIDMDNIQKMN